jgi:hypothetical protein
MEQKQKNKKSTLASLLHGHSSNLIGLFVLCVVGYQAFTKDIDYTFLIAGCAFAFVMFRVPPIKQDYLIEKVIKKLLNIEDNEPSQ